MSNPLFDISQYQIGASMSYSPDWIDGTGTDPTWDEIQLHPNLELDTTELDDDAQSNPQKAPTMAEAETSSSLHATSEVVEELSAQEAADRQQLELTVEQAFYQAGCALRELRDRRLYRDTHPDNFIGYCRDRFDKTKQAVNYLIAAAEIYGNLTTTIGCREDDEYLAFIGWKYATTNERQVRTLAGLEPDEQRQVWQEAVKFNGGKVPSGRIVKEVVERRRERNTTPPPIPYSKGEMVEICVGSNSTLRKHNGMWGIITHVGTFSCTVHISVRNVNVQCLPDEMASVDLKYTADIQAVHQRITALSELDLDPVILSMLDTLCRQTCFTQIQMNLLAYAEQQYGISPRKSEKT